MGTQVARGGLYARVVAGHTSEERCAGSVERPVDPGNAKAHGHLIDEEPRRPIVEAAEEERRFTQGPQAKPPDICVNRLDPARWIEGAEPFGTCVNFGTLNLPFGESLGPEVGFGDEVPIDENDGHAQKHEVLGELSADVADTQHCHALVPHDGQAVGTERRQRLETRVSLIRHHVPVHAQFNGSGAQGAPLVGRPHFRQRVS